MSETFWRRCSSCKSEIGFDRDYWTCSVSTCNRKRTGLLFCSVRCWEAHLPIARHRDAWAEEQRSPARVEWELQQVAKVPADRPRRRLVRPEGTSPASVDDGVPRETLVVVSKLKRYIKSRAEMSTSDGAMDVLSQHLRDLSDRAAREARRQGRKTVLDRDFRTVLHRDEES